ncbi:MAG: hypothetical protein MUE34_16025 [Acidimicrobiales bacterium]|nr:hypothetical protein [Acidimicrobiales bacterium]
MAADPSLRSLVDALGALAEIEGRLFELVGSWVPSTTDDALAVRFATVSRELGEHAVWWREAMPESVLLDPDAALRLPERWAAALDACAGVTQDAARCAVLHLVVLPAVAAACSALPVDERFVRRIRERVLADLAAVAADAADPTARVCADPAAAPAIGAGVVTVSAALARP